MIGQGPYSFKSDVIGCIMWLIMAIAPLWFTIVAFFAGAAVSCGQPPIPPNPQCVALQSQIQLLTTQCVMAGDALEDLWTAEANLQTRILILRGLILLLEPLPGSSTPDQTGPLRAELSQCEGMLVLIQGVIAQETADLTAMLDQLDDITVAYTALGC